MIIVCVWKVQLDRWWWASLLLKWRAYSAEMVHGGQERDAPGRHAENYSEMSSRLLVDVSPSLCLVKFAKWEAKLPYWAEPGRIGRWGKLWRKTDLRHTPSGKSLSGMMSHTDRKSLLGFYFALFVFLSFCHLFSGGWVRYIIICLCFGLYFGPYFNKNDPSRFFELRKILKQLYKCS